MKKPPQRSGFNEKKILCQFVISLDIFFVKMYDRKEVKDLCLE